MMRTDAIEDRLRSASLPAPPLDLRERVMAGSLRRVRRATTWAERMWFSRRWRLAAVALVFALFALDRISVVSGSLGGERPGAVALETARAADDAARRAGLSADEAAALARRALMAASQPSVRSRLSVDDEVTASDLAEPENR